MPVDPIVQQVLDAAQAAPPPDPSLSVAEQRAAAHAAMERSFLAMGEPGPGLPSVRDMTVPVTGGTITVRVYTPPGTAPLPVHVYFHGGAFWLGTLDHFDAGCRWLAAHAGCVIVSVDYRLAPEHHYPVPVEDCYAALTWTVDNAAALGVDPTLVSVGGGSAGGNLAAVVAMMARDRGGPSLVFQALDIPVTDLTMSQPSIRENGRGYLLTADSIRGYVRLYLGEAQTDRAGEPYASPLLAPDLTGLPPALVMTCEYDPLRDEGEAYGRRLQEAGVPVDARRWPGMIHGAGSFTRVLPAAREYRSAVADTLRRAYEQARVRTDGRR